MEPNNGQVESYLRDYISLQRSPGFGVMINGPWGSGKTFRMKAFIASIIKEEKVRVIFVSLYGLGRTKDIDDAIFAELHPVLSSKKAKLFAKVAKGFMKGAFKVDLDGDGKDDVTLNVQLPELTSSDLSESYDDTLIVFDDFERCTIDKNLLLGYINHFIETLGCKVILIANEEKVDSLGEYNSIKEKLIGATLRFDVDIDNIISDFCKNISTSPARDIANNNRELIREVYDNGNHSNLRILKHALFEYERIINTLEKHHTEVNELMSSILEEFLVFYIEVKSGSIKVEDIGKADSMVSIMLREKEGKESSEDNNRIKAFRIKHQSTFNKSRLFPSNVWQEIISYGTLDSTEMHAALDNSSYFQDEYTESWVKFWHIDDLSDDDAAKLHDEILRQFSARSFDNEGQFTHVVGVLLFLSQAGVDKRSLPEIVDEAKRYIDDLFAKGELLQFKVDDSFRYKSSGFAGLGYRMSESAELNEVQEYLISRYREADKNAYPRYAFELINLLKKSPSDFISAISIDSYGVGEFNDKPILVALDPSEFFQETLEFSSSQIKSIFHGLVRRYRHKPEKNPLRVEADWLDSLCLIIDSHVNTNSGKLSSYFFSVIHEDIKNIVQKLREPIAED